MLVLDRRRERGRSSRTGALCTVPALNGAVEVGAIKVDADAYRRHALGTLKTTGEILPGCVPVGEREHFGKDSGERGSTGDQ